MPESTLQAHANFRLGILRPGSCTFSASTWIHILELASIPAPWLLVPDRQPTASLRHPSCCVTEELAAFVDDLHLMGQLAPPPLHIKLSRVLRAFTSCSEPDRDSVRYEVLY